jgi:hypothetical protein
MNTRLNTKDANARLTHVCYHADGRLKKKDECLAALVQAFVKKDGLDPDFAHDLALKTQRDSNLWREEDHAKLLDGLGVVFIIGAIALVTPRPSRSSSYQPHLSLFIVPFLLGLALLLTAWFLRSLQKKKYQLK